MKKKYVNCETHGRVTGYCICRCIVDRGEPVRTVHEPNPNAQGIRRTIGDIICDKPAKEHTRDELLIICRNCAVNNGWTRVLAS